MDDGAATFTVQESLLMGYPVLISCQRLVVVSYVNWQIFPLLFPLYYSHHVFFRLETQGMIYVSAAKQ